jgi:hypothetical protein
VADYLPHRTPCSVFIIPGYGLPRGAESDAVQESS